MLTSGDDSGKNLGRHKIRVKKKQGIIAALFITSTQNIAENFKLQSTLEALQEVNKFMTRIDQIF